MERNLALEFVRVTEAAAIAASRWIGRGDKIAADGAAVKEMRARFNQIDFAGTVAIGEGKKDKAPELYNGEKVGTGKGPEMDLAIDPLECTDSVAHGTYNALSVIVAGHKNSLLKAPDTYMQKIAAGPKAAKVIDIDASVEENVKKVAQALHKKISDITVLTLDRPRHQDIINRVRNIGARVRLITDGDVAGAIAPSLPKSGIDLLIAVGASAEAVLAACAIKAFGGQLLCRFSPMNEEHKKELADFNITDLKKIYTVDDLAQGEELTFTATGIIDGPLLPGVTIQEATIITHSLVIRVKSGTIRYITTHHHYHSV